MFICVTAVEVCDATTVDSSNAAGKQIAFPTCLTSCNNVNVELIVPDKNFFALFCRHKYQLMKWLPSIAIVVLFAFSSCKSIKAPEFRGIENVHMSHFGMNESTLQLDLHYYNPNKSKLKLKNAEGDAFIENNLLGHFIIDTLITIPGKDDFRMPVTLQINMKKMLQNSALLLLKDEVTLKVDGKARVGKSGIFINYPIRYEGKQKTDSLTKMMDKLK